MKTVAIIIVTYNNEKTISDCLNSLPKSNKFLKIKTFVLDNASKDKTWKILQDHESESFFISKSKKNIGFARGVNKGIRFAQKHFESDYFFLLNPDAKLEENCLRRLVNVAKKNKNVGLLSPIIIDPKTKLPWFSGAKINWWRMRTEHNSRKFKTDYLSGCALLIKKKVIEKIGFFDKQFFLYYEDADFSLRAKRAGFGLKIVSNAICNHTESASSDSETKTYHLVKSGLIFFHKHYPLWALPYFWIVFGLRLFFHKFFTKKEPVIGAMEDFLREVKNA